MLKKSKKIKIALTMASISILTIVCIILYAKFGVYNNKAVALVNGKIIHESDIKEELLEIFPNSDPKTFEIEKLPNHVLELISQEIFIKKQIYKNAKRTMIYKDKSVKDKIDKYSKNIINEYYINSILDKKITQQILNDKYLELSEAAKDDQQYKISYILLNTEDQAQKIIEKLQNQENKSLENESFFDLAQKYSIDKMTGRKGGNLGYFTLKNIKKEFLLVEEMNEGEISKPIKTKDGWAIIKLTDTKNSKLEGFDQVKDRLVQEIKKEELNNIFAKITKNIEVKILRKF